MAFFDWVQTLQDIESSELCATAFVTFCFALGSTHAELLTEVHQDGEQERPVQLCRTKGWAELVEDEELTFLNPHNNKIFEMKTTLKTGKIMILIQMGAEINVTESSFVLI